MSFEIWLAFCAASFIVLIIPGPTIMLVMAYGVSHGRRAGLRVSAGVALGDLIAMTVSLAGLGAVIMASAQAFMLVKWLGALWLLYLGCSMIRSAGGTDQPVEQRQNSERIFLHATAVTALNPKSIGFFIAFAPQFVTVEAAYLPQMVIMIASFVTLATLNALAYALLADRAGAYLKHSHWQRWLKRGSDVVLMGLGVVTASLKRV